LSEIDVKFVSIMLELDTPAPGTLNSAGVVRPPGTITVE
jgi:hypothetical protein